MTPGHHSDVTHSNQSQNGPLAEAKCHKILVQIKQVSDLSFLTCIVWEEDVPVSDSFKALILNVQTSSQVCFDFF